MKGINEKSMNFNKPLKVIFDGGDLTGDEGLLLYQEFNHVIRLHQMIKEMIDIKDNSYHRYY